MKFDPLLKQLLTESLLKTLLRKPSQLALPLPVLRTALNQLSRVFSPNPEVTIRPLRLAGVRAEEIKPQPNATQLIFHIHGGAFFLGSLDTHRAFMTDIAARTQMQVLHVDYPLAPEHAFPEALEAVADIYQSLLDQGVQAKDIIVSGDSCGANLALVLALRLKHHEQPLPSALMLMSPFLDLTLTSESLRYNQKHDALLSIELLERGIAYYLPATMDRADPQVSPLFDDLSGLPPTLVQVGSKEILLDDAQRFKEKAEEAEVEVDFKIYTGMWHNFSMFSHWFSESQQALADLAEFAHKIDRT